MWWSFVSVGGGIAREVLSLRQHVFALAAPEARLVVHAAVQLQALHGVHGLVAHGAALLLDHGPHAGAAAHLHGAGGGQARVSLPVTSQQDKQHATSR